MTAMELVGQLAEARLRAQAAFESQKPRNVRNREGQFGTPPELARHVVSTALGFFGKRKSIRFIEPGFGTGAFLCALYEQVGPEAVELAVGYETDAQLVRMSREIYADMDVEVKLEDFTLAEPPRSEGEKFDLLICNPPYTRHHHIPTERKKEMQAVVEWRCGRKISGLAGMHAWFLVLGAQWLKPDGIAAWLVPGECCKVGYAEEIRRFLVEDVQLLYVECFDPRHVQFYDALVSSMIVVFANRRPRGNERVQFVVHDTETGGRRVGFTDIDALRRGNVWDFGSPRSAHRSGQYVRVGELFEVRRGIATGCNDFFVLDVQKAEAEKIEPEFLVPVLPPPKKLSVEEITSTLDGFPTNVPFRLLIRCDAPFEEVERRAPGLARYLETGRARGIPERYLCRRRAPWYRQEERPAAPLVCTYMARAFRVVLNWSDATCLNTYLMLYPKYIESRGFEVTRELRDPIRRALEHTAGRTYGGGLRKLEPAELADVPMEVPRSVLSSVQADTTPGFAHRHEVR